MISATLKALGFIRAVMLSFGLGALVAALMSWMSVVLIGGTRPAWAASLQTFGLEIALAFLSAAMAASMLMPRAADMTRPILQDEDVSSPPAFLLLLGALAVAAVVQAPAVAAWWAEDRTLLRQAIGSSRDPLSLDLIPQVILLSLPTLAAVALMAFVLASMLGMLVRVQFAFYALGACAALHAGLVIGLQLLLHAFRALGGAIQGLFTTAPDPVASAQALEWFARHDAASAPVALRLVWILGGYLAALAATALVSPRRDGDARRDRDEGVIDAASGTPGRTPVPPVVAVGRPSSAASSSSSSSSSSVSSSPSSVASAFDQSTYAVKPRQTLLELFLRHYSVYDIRSVPPTVRARFSFSWKTHVLRREPDGPDLYAVRPAERHGALRARSYVVIDLATGSPLGTLKPAGSEWEILDAAGTLVARVAAERAGAGFARYVATAGGQAIWRFTWAMQGLSVASAELDVELLPRCDAFADRTLAIALAPLLEHKGRRTSEWANR